MKQWKKLAFGVALATFGLIAAAKAQDYTALPRKETLIVENPEGTIKNPGWFNIWVNGGGGVSTGLQQLTMDTLWYIDPEKGLGGSAWDNSLASDKPQYNDDFTQMTVKLRKGLYWSDGVEFTADDVVYTVKTQMDHPGMNWSAAFSVQVASVEAPDPYTVVFKLKKPNSRFHAIFTVRWNGAWIMPKHIFEKVADPVRYDNANPVSLGAYKLKAYDPQGKWYTWEKRDDWQRTSLGRFGEPAPKYVTYVDPGPPDKRTIAQLEHNLDIIHDNTPEGMFTLKEKSKTVESWFPGFPFAHPDPTLPAVIFNNQDPLFQNPDVRWALALLIDIKAVDMASYRGAATLSALGVPPTAVAMTDYQAPMQDWLKNFEIDTGKRKIKPYDPTIGQQIADILRKQPKYKDQIPTDPAAISAAFGYGWWKPDPQAAGELLEKAGFKKVGGKWMTPDGQPFKIRLTVEGDTRSVFTRAGTLIAQQWAAFGIDSKAAPSTSVWQAGLQPGNYQVAIAWSVETWGGDPDLSFFLDSWHSQFVAKKGENQAPRNWQRWSNPDLDKIIENIRRISADDPKGIELGKDYLKLVAQQMPTIPLMSYNVFTSMDTTYWKGYPTIADPYTDPVPNWANSRLMMVKLKPAQP
ncbi:MULTISPECIES: ABC transporter substrate-binding protein [unclassified Rhizobium]|uniref:ABC transporter substrate-binding protein n=1 Tax=Rhizobium TaxID=379 RepID=UPI00084CC9BE|nr:MULTISPECIES: ABC transporter substrate-binding protein [unclassified Rhizobium]OEC95444.1 peptide ABC transporter [Rhizobium sp. YK2]QYA15055.1 ABC transporter substrate-binding protein [Rhizobium sp. AB2/73]UEQ84079.1 ABC transporter substrate-binding protein [Rhizobium sp. AB2/73]